MKNPDALRIFFPENINSEKTTADGLFRKNGTTTI
jgi:hypothetical protein